MKIEKLRILFTNIFFITSGNKRILIDTGYPLGKKRFFEKISNFDSIDFVILTHTHFDHAGNAAYLKEKGSIIVVHKNEASWLVQGETPRPPGVKHIGKTIMRFSTLKSVKFPPTTPDIVISELTQIEELVLVPTPGHTPGSISIVWKDIAFCGDLIMNLTWRPFSHLPIFAHDLNEVKKSIEKLVQMGVKVIYPAHGKPVKIENLKI